MEDNLLPRNIFSTAVSELDNGELWLPGELDGYALAPQPSGLYHLRKCYRNGGRSKVLRCGSIDDCKEWLDRYFHYARRNNHREMSNMRLLGWCNCKRVAETIEDCDL